MAEGDEKEEPTTKKAAKKAHKRESEWKSVKTMKAGIAEQARENAEAAKKMESGVKKLQAGIAEQARENAEAAKKMESGVRKMQAGISAFSSDIDKYIGQFYYG